MLHLPLRRGLIVYQIGEAETRHFSEEFVLTWVGDAPDPDGGRYVTVLNEVLRRLRKQFAGDATGEEPADKSRQTFRSDAHKATLRALKADALQVIAGTLTPGDAAVQAGRWLGRHDLRIERFEGTLFRSTLIMDEGDKKLAVDLEITITEGLPPPQDKPLPAQQSLFAEIASALTVVKTVYETNIETYAARAETTNDGRWEREQRRAQLKLNKYVRDLKGIAEVGLKDGFVDMAILALASLKAEFVSMEAPRIKNDYVWNLGRWAAGFALVALVISLLSLGTFPQLVFLQPFAIAGVGAAIGTWLSFSIRRVTLTFEQLAVPEEDMLRPAFRILVVLALTVGVMLIFYTGVMNIQIGDLNTTLLNGTPTKPDATTGKVPSLPAISLLVGLFCGIAERALSSAVGQRAIDFVTSIGGTKR